MSPAGNAPGDQPAIALHCPAMKKLLVLVIVVVLAAFAVKKLQDA